MIGLLGGNDSQINKLEPFLPEPMYVHINTESFPESPDISIRSDGIEYEFLDEDIEVYYVDAYHSSVKRPFKEEDDTEIDVNRRYVFATAEKDSFLRSLLKIEQDLGKLVINRPDIKDFHYLKPYQLFKLQQAGVSIPDSVHTNSVAEVRELFDQYDDLVYKPIGSLGRADVHNLEEFENRKDTLAHAPVTFQEYCEGDNLRVYILDGEVIGCYRILTDTEVVDYRGFERGVEPVSVSDRLARISIKTAQVLGMRFAGVDLIRSDDRIVILECNSGPHFAGVEAHLDTDEISRALANFLRCHHEQHEGENTTT
ncbi:RimK family alpha-L-glutamate ligase [Natrinema hispanicum]|uniref:Glutathione synthase/RimK-type ligase, ATP-grasp superfamily n=1 Tax=Natrinema hispanicum TaxID=392421 RepID=A0A1G6UZ36_9EURY|nr:ATP-grasp domain-containing protein [Natrinema hispanicum]SDD46582.1 Glutathione synthase/RimK-type ligase, ATP-grasp superfamily [Natrinema hispanicum]